MRILLIGMMGLYNRGCEALVRGTQQILADICADLELSVAVGYPDTAALDADRLKDIGIGIYPLCMRSTFWENIPQRIYSKLVNRKFAGMPTWCFPRDGWDLFFETGGDTFIGKDINNRLDWDKNIMKIAKTEIALWGMNIGPYSSDIIDNSELKRSLEMYSFITLRDSYSYDLLKSLDVQTNIYRMTDPAFSMRSEPWDLEEYFPPEDSNGIIGFNLSPFAQQVRGTSRREVIKLCVETAKLLCDNGFSVLFVPHCFPPACPDSDNDALVMQPAFDILRANGCNVGILPDGLSSPQIKYAISRCLIFTGARMHSTIAAWSSGIPVLSLSYSTKSLNLNNEIYGSLDYVINIANAEACGIVDKIIVMCNRTDDIANRTVIGVNRYMRLNNELMSSSFPDLVRKYAKGYRRTMKDRRL